MKKLIWILLVVGGCSPVYVPNARNSPLFTKAGEFQGTVAFGNGLDVQTAVAVTNHIGLMGNFSYESRQGSKYTNNFDEDDYHYHRFFEGGVGYFDNSKEWGYEVFAGYGKGEGASYASYVWWNYDNLRATGKYDRVFFQPAIGLNKKIVHVSFVPRLTLVDFKSFSSDVSTYKIDEGPKVFFEPGVVGRVNLAENHLILMFQAGFTFPPGFDDPFYDYRGFQFSTGLGFRIGGTPRTKPAE